jgi:hypothetical protein
MKIHGNTHDFNFYNEYYHIFSSLFQNMETTFQNKTQDLVVFVHF